MNEKKMEKTMKKMMGLIVLTMFVGMPLVSAHEADESEIPQEYKDLVNPVPATNESISSGKEAYTQNCAVCHGIDGKPMLPKMKEEGIDFSNKQMMSEMTDNVMFWKISEGVIENGVPTLMPFWNDKLSEDERWNVINYIRTLSVETGAETPSTTAPAPTTAAPEPVPEPTSEQAPEAKGICGPTLVMLVGILPLAYRAYRRRVK